MRTIALALLVASCGSTARPTSTPAPTERDPRFVAEIRDTAAAYLAWGRVDEWPNVAPILCAPPTLEDHGSTSRVRLSHDDDAPHGAKLYYLWASDRWNYQRASEPIPVGFAIVKQSFHARPATPQDLQPLPPREVPAPVPSLGEAGTGELVEAPPARAPRPEGLPLEPPIQTLQVEGRWLATGAPAGLFVMKKLGDRGLAGSDAGWIYGTVDVDGRVTSAGRVATCMGCHEDAARERLFGLR
ncbi:MAG: hypothetical protein ACTHU0_28695 [Kofleriaceae bacterium]